MSPGKKVPMGVVELPFLKAPLLPIQRFQVCMTGTVVFWNPASMSTNVSVRKVRKVPFIQKCENMWICFNRPILDAERGL